MSVVVKYAGSTLTNALQNEDIDGLTSAAQYGELGSGGVPLQTATTIVGWKSLVIEESDCSVVRMYSGYVTGRPIRRLNPGLSGLVWDCDVVDLNAILSLRVITGSDGARPAETDLARVSWLMASDYMADPAIVNSGFVNTSTGGGNFGATDYRGQTPLEVLTSLAPSAAKLFYVYWDNTASAISLYYDLVSATNRTSTITISNDPADASSTCFAPQPMTPSDSASVTRSPEDVFGGMYYQYSGSAIYRRKTATDTAFIRRDFAYSTDRVGKLTTAETQAQAFLDLHDTELDTIEVELLLPAASVNLLREGERTSVKLTHIAAYTSPVFLRVRRRTIAYEAPGLYRVRYELSNNRLASSGSTGGTPVGSVFPSRPCSGSLAFVQSKANNFANSGIAGTTVLDAAPTVGNLLVIAIQMRVSGTRVPTGFTAVTAGVLVNGTARRLSIWYRVVQSGDTATINYTGLGSAEGRQIAAEFTGSGVFDVFDSDSVTSDVYYPSTRALVTGTVTPSHGKPVLLFGISGGDNGDADNEISAVADGSAVLLDHSKNGTGMPYTVVLYQLVPAATGAYSLSATVGLQGISHGTTGILAAFYCDGATAGPPRPGQPVNNEVPTPATNGTTKIFFTRWPYFEGSLVLRVDGLASPGAVAETNPDTGEFTMSYAPLASEKLRVDYQGR